NTLFIIKKDMTTFTIHRHRFRSIRPVVNIHPLIQLFIPILLLTWTFPSWIYHFDHTAALPDVGIWSLLLLAIAVFLMILLLCWYLFNKSWERLNLPGIKRMVSQFKYLELWQQFVLYW